MAGPSEKGLPNRTLFFLLLEPPQNPAVHQRTDSSGCKKRGVDDREQQKVSLPGHRAGKAETATDGIRARVACRINAAKEPRNSRWYRSGYPWERRAERKRAGRQLQTGGLHRAFCNGRIAFRLPACGPTARRSGGKSRRRREYRAEFRKGQRQIPQKGRKESRPPALRVLPEEWRRRSEKFEKAAEQEYRRSRSSRSIR